MSPTNQAGTHPPLPILILITKPQSFASDLLKVNLYVFMNTATCSKGNGDCLGCGGRGGGVLFQRVRCPL